MVSVAARTPLVIVRLSPTFTPPNTVELAVGTVEDRTPLSIERLVPTFTPPNADAVAAGNEYLLVRLSYDISMFAVPSNDVPAIVLAFFNAVAVAALPVVSVLPLADSTPLLIVIVEPSGLTRPTWSVVAVV